ncbi:lasso peptide biosynthesis B2 protein [Streptomyces sp. NPDC054796]
MPVTPKLYTARLPGGGAAVMDIRTGRGRWQHLNSTAALLWQRLLEGEPLEQAVDDLTASFAAQGADAETVRTDLTALAQQWHQLGLTTASAAPAPDPGEVPVRAALPGDTPLGAADRAAGLTGLAVALVLLHCAPIRASIRAARLLARVPRRVASPERADLLFAAVRRAARLWPGRSACLEESLACYVAGVMRGAHVAWVIGARTAPAAAHAWNEAGGWVIGQDLGDRVWPYAPAIRLHHAAHGK